MKTYNYKISQATTVIFFPSQRIKTKKQILKILLETVRVMLVENSDENLKEQNSYFKVVIDKMSRIFYFSDKKYYSIYFPFTYIIDNGKNVISFKNQIEINSQIISNIIEILNDTRFESFYSLDFIEPINELESYYEDKLWFLIRELIMLEDGYVRFDNDIDNFNKAKQEGKEHTHPENHFDIFYSNGNIFKIGLERIIKTLEFEDYFNVATDCKYLKNYR